MAQEQRPLMLRVLPEGGDSHFWKHYPEKDARDAKTKSRWYYHVHAPGSRDKDEHGKKARQTEDHRIARNPRGRGGAECVKEGAAVAGGDAGRHQPAYGQCTEHDDDGDGVSFEVVFHCLSLGACGKETAGNVLTINRGAHKTIVAQNVWGVR